MYICSSYCIIFSPFSRFFIICSISSLSRFSIIGIGSTFFPGVILLAASSICLSYASVNILSPSICLLTFSSLFTSVYYLFFEFFFLRIMYFCLVLLSSDGWNFGVLGFHDLFVPFPSLFFSFKVCLVWWFWCFWRSRVLLLHSSGDPARSLWRGLFQINTFPPQSLSVS